jgi:16S rRNA (guanine966-N2)-methyltransferase
MRVKNCLTQMGFFCSIDSHTLIMRIAGGIGKGQRLKVPAGSRVRPTSDKVKQALFNILADRVEGASFLDLFAGAGGIGIEALSRGASRVVFVDGSRESVAVIKKNIETARVHDRAEVVPAKTETYLKKQSGPFDIVFLDPPYAEELGPLLELIAASGVVQPGGIVIAEHFKKQSSPEAAGALARYREARYGDTVLVFYRDSRRSS